ncbi:MAG: serine protease [Verrucomicrobiae bacterium]|nr:serine protease [Verrucomicrobiae bacterium]
MKVSVPLFAILFSSCPMLFGLDTAQPRIVGGTKAPANAYPWMVALASKTGGKLFDRQFCAGSLIAPHWVLTAAHCVEGEVASNLEVVMGFNDLDDTSGAEIRGVKAFFVHPGYADIRGDLVNDIALLFLDSPVNSITPVSYSKSPSPLAVGETVRAIGWGDTQSSPRFPTELRQVDLALESISYARRVYGSNQINQRHLAAIGNGKDTCGGDSGGPLFDLDGDSGNPLVVGLTSFGLRCAQRDVPGIYTNVGNYSDWVDFFLGLPTSGDPVAELSGHGRPIGNPSYSPRRANGTHFGRKVRSGRVITRRFPLSNENGTFPLSIEKSGSTNRNFKVSTSSYVLSGATGVVNVRFRAPYSRRRNSRSLSRITLRLNDPANPAYVFRVLSRHGY